MTEQNEATAVEEATAEVEIDTADTPDNESASSSREAAKWRTKFRDAETQIAALTERVTLMQRAEAERIAGEALADPTDLWRGDVAIDQLLDDDGHLDAAAVRAATAEIVGAHRHWQKVAPAAVPADEVGSNGRIGGDAADTFVDAFRPRTG